MPSPATTHDFWTGQLQHALPSTPAYVYDLAELRRNAAALLGALPAGSLLYSSLKANAHPVLQDTLRRAGARAEVCSPGEVDSALAAGFDPARILYTGPGRRDTDVAHALAAGVREFSVDSPVGLAQLDRLAAAQHVQVRCLLRVNDDEPARGQGLAMTGVTSQFGADTGWILAQPARFTGTANARVTGLHLYMGSNLGSVEDLLGQFARSLRTAERLRQALGVRFDVLDLGGGFGAPFARAGRPLDLTGLRPGLEDLLDRHAPGWRDGGPRPAFESGRFLLGTAGTLLVRVLDVKRSHGQRVAVLESGINHLGGMSGLRRLPPLSPHVVTDVPIDAAGVPTLLAGPLCTPLDVWSRNAELPPLEPGQLLAVPNVGAYGLSASLLGFLGHPTPVEAVIDTDSGDVVDVSRLQLTRVPATAG
jgi:diaminopimelate decarboxylase